MYISMMMVKQRNKRLNVGARTANSYEVLDLASWNRGYSKSI